MRQHLCGVDEGPTRKKRVSSCCYKNLNSNVHQTNLGNAVEQADTQRQWVGVILRQVHEMCQHREKKHLKTNQGWDQQ